MGRHTNHIVRKFVSNMLYVISGEDFDFFTKEKNTIKTKHNLEAEYTLDDPLLIGTLVEQFCQDGFFETPKHLIILKYLLDEVTEEVLAEMLPLLASYGHTVILHEHTLPKKLPSVFSKATMLETKKSVAKEVLPTPFAFTDYVIARDKKNAWLSFSDLITSGVPVGQISAALFWAFKTLFLVKTGTQVENPEIKPFVFNKMKRQTGAWDQADIAQMLKSILEITTHEQFDEDAQRMKFEQILFAL